MYVMALMIHQSMLNPVIYMLITSKNMLIESISFDDVNYITEEDYNNINKRSKVDDGDIIMPMIGQ